VKLHVHVAVVIAFGGWPQPTPNPSGYVLVLVPLIVVFAALSSIAGNDHGWTDASLVRPETSVTRNDPSGAPRWPSAPMRRRPVPMSVILSAIFISWALVQRSDCSRPPGSRDGYVLRPLPCTLHVAGHV
jgi:hypothetical protein